MVPFDQEPTAKLRSALHFRYSLVNEVRMGITSFYFMFLLSSLIFNILTFNIVPTVNPKLTHNIVYSMTGYCFDSLLNIGKWS